MVHPPEGGHQTHNRGTQPLGTTESSQEKAPSQVLGAVVSLFWQPWWLARSVVVVDINGYTIESGADLSGANLERVYAAVHGVIADKYTTWPPGFDPATSLLAVHPRSD